MSPSHCKKGVITSQVYHIRKRGSDRSYAWFSGENKMSHSQVADMGQSSGSVARSTRGKRMES